MHDARYCWLGRIAYRQAGQLQTELISQVRPGAAPVFLALEHPPVFTCGRRGGMEHLTAPPGLLTTHGITIEQVERGGLITYHGPGQLVLYPILHLHREKLTVTDYVVRLEETMLRLAAGCGVTAGRDPRNHGVWIGNQKVGSIGIAIRHGVCFHGLALNVNLDLEPCRWINPCGLCGVTMTSLSAASKQEIDMAFIRDLLPGVLTEVFGVSLLEIAPAL